MNTLIKKLKINEKFTKPRTNKQKEFNHIKNNIPLLEDYNFMADLLEFPETKEKYKYLLVVVDLASDEFDIEPLKNKTPDTVLDGFKTMITKRKHISKPYASIRTDNGTEFKGIFHKWLSDNDILHKVNLPNRHKQLANVESLNKLLGRLFNGYMNMKEEETGKVYKEWTDILNIVRKELNKSRKIKLDKTFNPDKHKNTFSIEKAGEPKFKLGSVVHEKLDWAESALGKKQPTPNFRVGDYRYSTVPKKIIKIITMNDFPYYRYMLEGLPNVSYSDYELIPSKFKQTRYKVKKIIDRKVEGNKTYYLIWWDKFKKGEATWEPETQLRKDGLGSMIEEFNDNN
jgi:hypothetical protein